MDRLAGLVAGLVALQPGVRILDHRHPAAVDDQRKGRILVVFDVWADDHLRPVAGRPHVERPRHMHGLARTQRHRLRVALGDVAHGHVVAGRPAARAGQAHGPGCLAARLITEGVQRLCQVDLRAGQGDLGPGRLLAQVCLDRVAAGQQAGRRGHGQRDRPRAVGRQHAHHVVGCIEGQEAQRRIARRPVVVHRRRQRHRPARRTGGRGQAGECGSRRQPLWPVEHQFLLAQRRPIRADQRGVQCLRTGAVAQRQRLTVGRAAARRQANRRAQRLVAVVLDDQRPGPRLLAGRRAAGGHG